MVPSHFLIGSGISLAWASGGDMPTRSSNEGKASRLIKHRKIASSMVVVRLHCLSLPLRNMIARVGESM